MLSLKKLIFLGLLAFSASACDDSMPGAPIVVVPPGPNGRIVYSSVDPNSKETLVHVIDSSGSEVVSPRKGLGLAKPGKTKLAWTYTTTGGDVELWEGPIHLSTSSKVTFALVDHDIIEGSAVMSPAGDKVAFSAVDRNTGEVSLYYYKPGSGFSPSPILVAHDFASVTLPAFSPDGNKIAYFYETIDGTTQGFAIANVSSESTVLETDLTSRMGPFTIAGAETIDWSPDGTEILFSTGSVDFPQFFKQYLYTKGQLQTSDYLHGVFSPDGKKIAYIGLANGGLELQLHVELRDGGRTQMTFSPDSVALYPCWSPDGKKIVYTSVPVVGDDFNGTLMSIDVDDASKQQVLVPSGATRAYWIKREGQ